jgi:hypothetical protein
MSSAAFSRTQSARELDGIVGPVLVAEDAQGRHNAVARVDPVVGDEAGNMLEAG